MAQRVLKPGGVSGTALTRVYDGPHSRRVGTHSHGDSDIFGTRSSRPRKLRALFESLDGDSPRQIIVVRSRASSIFCEEEFRASAGRCGCAVCTQVRCASARGSRAIATLFVWRDRAGRRPVDAAHLRAGAPRLALAIRTSLIARRRRGAFLARHRRETFSHGANERLSRTALTIIFVRQYF